MRRVRFEGTAARLWLLAALLATLFFLLDPTLGPFFAPQPRTEPPPTRFFELPPLPPPGSDAGVRDSPRR